MNAAEAAAAHLAGALVISGPMNNVGAFGLATFTSPADVCRFCLPTPPVSGQRVVTEPTPALSELAAYGAASRIAFELGFNGDEPVGPQLPQGLADVLAAAGRAAATEVVALADCALAVCGEQGRLRVVWCGGPILGGKGDREAFLGRLMREDAVRQLCAAGTLVLEPFYTYRSRVPLIWCPGEDFDDQFWPQTAESVEALGRGDGRLVNDDSTWDAAVLERHMVTVAADGAPRVAGLRPAGGSSAVLGPEHRRALEACSGRGWTVLEADVVDVVEFPTGFQLTASSRAPARCPAAGLDHPAGTVTKLMLSGGVLSLTCGARARWGAVLDDVQLNDAAMSNVDRVGHGALCCVAPLGLLLPAPPAPTLRPPVLVEGVPRCAPLTRAARSACEAPRLAPLWAPGPAARGRKLVVVDSSDVGMGKSFAAFDAVVEHVVAERRAERDVWVVLLESHVVLVKDVVGKINQRLASMGLPLAKAWHDDEGADLLTGVVVTCAPSAWRLLRGGRSAVRPDRRARLFVVCDEVAASLNMLRNGQSEGGGRTAEERIQNIAGLFAKADTLIISDADASRDNAGHLLALAGLERVAYVKTDAYPWQGQEARTVLGVSVGDDGQPVYEPYGCVLELFDILDKPHKPNVLAPVSTVKIGRVIAEFVGRRFPDVLCLFLHRHSPNKAELLERFKAFKERGQQVLFIASPALVTGVSQDTGFFDEVFEVLSAYTTSATDAKQRRARARVHRGVAPLLTNYVADSRVAFANLRTWAPAAYDAKLNTGPAFLAHVASRRLDCSSVKAALGLLKMAALQAECGVPAALSVGGVVRNSVDYDAYYLRTVRGDYVLTPQALEELVAAEAVERAATDWARHATAARRLRGRGEAAPEPSAVAVGARQERRPLSDSGPMRELLLRPRVEAANRVRTILAEIRAAHVDAKRLVHRTELRVYSGELKATLNTVTSFAKELDGSDYDQKAVYVLERLLCFGEPAEGGPLFRTRDDFYHAMVQAEVEAKAEGRKRPAPTSPAAAPAANDSETLLPDEDETGEGQHGPAETEAEASAGV